jgi:hypothetical protein
MLQQPNKVFGIKTENNRQFIGVEIYTKHPTTGEEGWDIEFVDVYAKDTKEVVNILQEQHPLFDCVILF